MEKFYIYYHINPIDNQPFYVGKGSGSRLYEWNRGRNKAHYELQNKINEEGLRPKAIKIAYFKNEMEAYKIEKEHIRMLIDQGIQLVNKSPGGVNLSGTANPMFGKKRPDVVERNLLNKGKTLKELYGEKRALEIGVKLSKPGALNPMFGKKRPDLVERNLSQKGKSHEEIFGKDKANEIKEMLGGIKIIRNDGTIYFSIKSAAKELLSSKYLLKRHLEGHIANIKGYTFQYVTTLNVLTKQS